MGCSESAPVAQKKEEQPKPPEPLLPKTEDTPHFIIGHISEQQYLFAKVSLTNQSFNRLSIPQQFQPHNFSSMLALNSKQYIISGGIDFTMKDITNLCFIYDVNNHTISKIASMIQARYTHTALYINNHVYVFGGRFYGSDDEAILSSCQAYSMESKEWIKKPDLNIKRCTCYALQWKQDIYVFGGYTGEFQRSQKIERLNIKQNKWKIVDFELNRGIQSAYVISVNSNEVMIFGGNTNSGPTASVLTLNLNQQTVRSHRHLKEPKMLHKGFTLGRVVYIFGGSDRGDLQIYDLLQNKSDLVHFKLNEQFPPQIFEGLAYSQQSLIVDYESSSGTVVECEKEDDVVITFGTTEEPFIFQLNVSVPSTQVWSVPLSLKLYAEAGGVHLQDLEFMLFGGIEDDSFSTITSDAYLYDHKKRYSKKLPSMLMARYSFAFKKIGSRIYALGGGNSDPDGNLQFLDSCEYFDIDKQTWNPISNLPVPLTSSTALEVHKTLYLFGGISQDKIRNKSIYKYDQKTDSWSQLSFHLPFGIEATTAYSFNHQQFYIFGGRLDNGDSDQIWNLLFTQKGAVQCSLIEKGKLSEKKNSVKVFKPKNQTFLVCLGGQEDLVSYYDVHTLKSMEWDGLRKLKEVFSKEFSNLNNTKMMTYLTISASNQS